MKLGKKLIFQICLMLALVAFSAVGVYLIMGNDDTSPKLPETGGGSEFYDDPANRDIYDGLTTPTKVDPGEGPSAPQEYDPNDVPIQANTDFDFTVQFKVWSGGSVTSGYSYGYFHVYWRRSDGGTREWQSPAPTGYTSRGKTKGGGGTGDTSVTNIYYFSHDSTNTTSIWPKRYAKVSWYVMSDYYTSSYFGHGKTLPSSSNWKTSYTTSNYSNFYIYGSGNSATSESTAQDNCSQTVTGDFYIVLRRTYTAYKYNATPSQVSTATITDGIAYNVGTHSYTRTGYTADGWTTSSSCLKSSGTWYDDNSTIYPTGNVYLYPAFVPIRYYVRNYLYKNTGVSSAPTSGSISISSTPTYSGSLTNYTNYWYRYYYHDYSGSSSKYFTYSVSGSSTYGYYLSTSSSISSIPSSVNSMTVYWYPYPSNTTSRYIYVYCYQRYLIQYNGNGYTGGTVPSSQYKAHGVNLTLSSSKPTRTGYLFQGWSTSSTATSASYSAGSSFSSNGNYTLYAVWTPITYSVRYNRNETAYSNRSSLDTASGTMADSSHVYDTAKTLTANAFTMTNWSFAGWNTNSAGTGTNYSNSASVKNLTTSSGGVVNLYAKWTPITISIKVNIVTYTTSGATSSTVGGTASVTYDNASSATTTASQTAATATYTAHKQQNFKITATAKSGYTLVGITNSSSCPTTATNTTGKTWNPTSAATYYVYFRQQSAYRMQKSGSKYYISSTTLGWAPQTKVSTPSGISTDGTFTVPGGSTYTVYKDGSGNKYVYAGGAYFKFEPIVWLVSKAPSYGATSTDITVVSEKILFASRVNSSTSVGESWSYQSSEMYTWSKNIQTALNLGTNLKSKTWTGTKYAAAGTEGKVTADNYSASAAQVASMAEIEAVYSSSYSGYRNAYCTDFAYYLMTGSTTMPTNVSERYLDCWTRDLADQRGTAKFCRVATDAPNNQYTMVKDVAYLDQVKGVRLSAFMTTATYY